MLRPMSILIYGGNGYTGELIARFAKDRGMRPILAGRSESAVAEVAHRHDLPYRVFDLADPAAVDRGLGEDVRVVLHCAGPFSRTSRPMVDGCLRRKVHYLDITGEVEVFEACAARDHEARDAEVMVMPGVGFDVVPTDCLAAHLARRLPGATHLSLGFQVQQRPSRGTATTMIENLHRGGLVRLDGRLTPVPAAHRTRMIDFDCSGRGPVPAVTIPWGDVSTAYHSTRIPNVEVYMAAPLMMRIGSRLLSALGPLLANPKVQGFLIERVRAGKAGPTDAERARGAAYIWGEAREGTRTMVSRLKTPEGYTLTALAALEIATRVDRGEVKAGYQTPASAYGPDLILSLQGCTRSDEV